MSSKILINAQAPEECRIAIVKDSKLEVFHIESAAKEITQGNIYKGIITRIEPGLQSVFVDYGAERNGFLQKHEIHRDYFQDSDSGDHSLTTILKRGQELLVQVTKDPVMNKGAMLTTYLSLAGRFLVLMPGSKSRGISRKIENEEERTRLKELVGGLSLPEEYGLIVRTVGVNANKTLLNKDLRYLLRLWKNVKEKGVKPQAPALLYKDQHLVLRFIRDYLNADINGILADDAAVFQEVKDFVKIISPKHTKTVKLHQTEKPIFSKYQLEEQIASIYENRVTLKSGGSVVIDQTEALVAIDVNSGKGTHKKSIEQTAFMTNMEAAEEIARQLRLRDLGGLIVIDFIDMKETKHKTQVENAFKKHTKADRARMKVGKISRFGLLELSRQRIRPSIDFGSFVPCRHCKGKGLAPSTETLAIGFLRKLHMEVMKNGVVQIKGVVPTDVADYILNKKRKELLDLEIRHEKSISIVGDAAMAPWENDIVSGP